VLPFFAKGSVVWLPLGLSRLAAFVGLLCCPLLLTALKLEVRLSVMVDLVIFIVGVVGSFLFLFLFLFFYY
jgi:hypothetical protein